MKTSLTVAKALLITGLAASSLTARAEDKFRVCADPVNPPYSTKELTGYENKIASLFAKQLGQEVEYTWLPERIGFIRNTLKAENENGEGFKCDVVMGVPAGYDLTETTKPYFHSTYVLLIAKGRGLDDITDASQLANLPPARQEKLKIAMFDRGPGTAWIQKNGLLEQGVPYQSMTGDGEHNVAMQIDKDLRDGVIDMVILWGPMAGYVQSQNPIGSFIAIPMQSSPDLKFDFSIAMGVRQGDNKRKQQLNELIANNLQEIHGIIGGYQIPLLPIPEHATVEDDD